MKLTRAFLRLIRWPNLIFIVLTQFLFYYCIILPNYHAQAVGGAWFLSWSFLAWLSFASVLIAAAGYIINDYFDLNIDQVNKPDSIIIQKYIKRRWAIFWHLSLSFAGVLITVIISWKIGNWVIGPVNLCTVLLLLFYSTTFKKKFLIGNIIISLLTAWVVFVLYISELDLATFNQQPFYRSALTKIFKLAVLYGGFAFVISLQNHAGAMGHTCFQGFCRCMADCADTGGVRALGLCRIKRMVSGCAVCYGSGGRSPNDNPAETVPRTDRCTVSCHQYFN
jgi:4-hydroxybenzoate polyprenyltransferase